MKALERRVPRGLTPQARILDGVEVDPNSGCWLWSDSASPGGYGQLTYQGRLQRAHRLAYQAFIGELPPGKMVCHRCDTRVCCNPNHFFLGSSQDNIDDMVRKRRTCSGLRRSRQVFTGTTSRKVPPEEYSTIIARRNRGETYRSIAQSYGVHLATIHRITSGQRFASVGGALLNAT